MDITKGQRRAGEDRVGVIVGGSGDGDGLVGEGDVIQASSPGEGLGGQRQVGRAGQAARGGGGDHHVTRGAGGQVGRVGEGELRVRRGGDDLQVVLVGGVAAGEDGIREADVAGGERADVAEGERCRAKGGRGHIVGRAGEGDGLGGQGGIGQASGASEHLGGEAEADGRVEHTDVGGGNHHVARATGGEVRGVSEGELSVTRGRDDLQVILVGSVRDRRVRHANVGGHTATDIAEGQRSGHDRRVGVIVDRAGKRHRARDQRGVSEGAHADGGDRDDGAAGLGARGEGVEAERDDTRRARSGGREARAVGRDRSGEGFAEAVGRGRVREVERRAEGGSGWTGRSVVDGRRERAGRGGDADEVDADEAGRLHNLLVQEGVIDTGEVEGGEVTRRRARAIDDLVSTRACTVRGEAERATEGDVTADSRLGGSVRRQGGTRRTEGRRVGASERELTSDRETRGIERGTRGDRERLGGTHVDRAGTHEGLTGGEREAIPSGRVEGRTRTDGDGGRSGQTTERGEGERAGIHIECAREGRRCIQGQRTRAGLDQRARATDGVSEDHVVAVGVDGARLGGRNRQAIRDIVEVTRGELQRGVTREAQAGRTQEHVRSSDFQGALGELEATREGVGRSERQRAGANLLEAACTRERTGEGHIVGADIDGASLANIGDQDAGDVGRDTRGILQGGITGEGNKRRRTEGTGGDDAIEGRRLGHGQGTRCDIDRTCLDWIKAFEVQFARTLLSEDKRAVHRRTPGNVIGTGVDREGRHSGCAKEIGDVRGHARAVDDGTRASIGRAGAEAEGCTRVAAGNRRGGVQNDRVIGRDETSEEARAAEDELTRARLDEGTRAREAAAEGDVLRTTRDGEGGEGIEDVDDLGQRARSGTSELQGRGGDAGRQVQVHTGTEGRVVTNRHRAAEEIGVTGVGIHAVQDDGAGGGRAEGELAARRARARAAGNDGVDRQGRGNIREEEARGVHVERDTTVSGEGDVGRGLQRAASEGELASRGGDRRSAEGRAASDDELTASDGGRASEGRAVR